jgi:hypothetical protein
VADKRSPELDLDDVFRRIQRTALSNNSNPDRIGCFSEETLAAFAIDPRSFSMRDPIFEHLALCSECFQFVHARRFAK